MTKNSEELEGLIAKMLRPLKGIKLNLAIEGLTGYQVIEFNNKDEKDKEILDLLVTVANNVKHKVNSKGIKRTRPNEVGNDIEPIVKKELLNKELIADTPKAKNGSKKSTGYPDLEFKDNYTRWHYLECKTYNIDNVGTTQRSFYLSPSDNFKITRTAHHFAISFEIYVEKRVGNKNLYKVNGWKIIDLSNLELDVKHEFNSDNKRLYDDELVLASD